jgi:hypothetical protein
MSVLARIEAEVREAKAEAEALLRVAKDSEATDAEKDRARAAVLQLKAQANRIDRQLTELAGSGRNA